MPDKDGLPNRYRLLIAEDPNDLRILFAGHCGETFYYRGQSQACWALSTTIEREYKAEHRTQEEQRILHSFSARAGEYLENAPDHSDPLEWLSIIQHHGGPTRMLDFTDRVYVAAFFAVLPQASAGCFEDAAIWAINVLALNKSRVAQVNPVIQQTNQPAGSNLGYPYLPIRWDSFSYDSGGDDPSLSAQIHRVESDLLTGSIEEGDSDPGVLPFQPRQLNRRMQAQHARILVPRSIRVTFWENLWKHINPNVLETSEEPSPVKLCDQSSVDMWHNDALLKIILPANSISTYWEFLRETNLTEDVLFPDLQGLVASLRAISRSAGAGIRRTQ